MNNKDAVLMDIVNQIMQYIHGNATLEEARHRCEGHKEETQCGLIHPLSDGLIKRAKMISDNLDKLEKM